MKGIEVKQVVKQFNKETILDGIGFTLEPNKIYGLLGRNGAGKSTILNILVDRIQADSGVIRVDGEILRDNDQVLSKMFLMSEVNLYPQGEKVKQIFKWTERLYDNFNMQQARYLSHQFDLDLEAVFSKLSTGYRTIMKLIIALSVPVEYVFLDEPVLGLDANHRDIFYKELIATYNQNPRTFVISTHLIEEAANLVEHVMVLEEGRLIIDDDTENVLANAYMISGPEQEVDEYSEGLNIIGSDRLARIKATYVYGELHERPIPDLINIDKMDLQTLFINLTKAGEQNE